MSEVMTREEYQAAITKPKRGRGGIVPISRDEVLSILLLGKPGDGRHFVRTVAANAQGDECLIWPYGRMPRGYGRISLRRRSFLAHRIVCLVAHGEPGSTSSLACHSCGNGHLGCVNQKHIYWGSPRTNQLDRVEHGTSNRGERHGASKLTSNDVLAIRSLSANGKKNREIAAYFGVAHQTISKIMSGKAWSWL
jgi:hypothetical protein